jgi:hypothetical protein
MTGRNLPKLTLLFCLPCVFEQKLPADFVGRAGFTFPSLSSSS